MIFYTFKVQQVLYGTIGILAESTEEARGIVEQMSFDGEIDTDEIEEVNYILLKAEESI